MDMLQKCYGNDGIYNLIYIDDGVYQIHESEMETMGICQ